MIPLDQDPVFTALTHPQMFAGVTYGWFVVNAVATAEAFLITKSAWVLGLALLLHIVGLIACVKEPRFLDLWLVKIGRSPRIPNHRFWGCNSYGP